jgi:hypothetical protein
MRSITDMEDYPDVPRSPTIPTRFLLLQLPLQLLFVHSKGLEPPQIVFFLYPVTAEAENPLLRKSHTGLEKAIYITQ